MPFGGEVVSDATLLAGVVLIITRHKCLSAVRSFPTIHLEELTCLNMMSQMPFGGEVVSDLKKRLILLPLLMSQMPFGGEVVSDARRGNHHVMVRATSQMPFGGEVVSDPAAKQALQSRLGGHKCLSAVRSFPTSIGHSQ